MVSRWSSVSLSIRLSYVRMSVSFSFPDDNLSKRQWIFTKLGMCNFYNFFARDMPIFSFPDYNLSK